MNDDTSTLPPYSSQLAEDQHSLEEISPMASSLSQLSIQRSAIGPTDQQAQALCTQMISSHIIISKLGTLQSSLSAIISSFHPPPPTEDSQDEFPSVRQSSDSTSPLTAEDLVLEIFREIEQMVSNVASTLSSACSRKVNSPPIVVLELAKPPPHSDKLTTTSYRIEVAKFVMFELENIHGYSGNNPPPPSGAALDDEDIFLCWCRSKNVTQYKVEIYRFIESLRNSNEELEESRRRQPIFQKDPYRSIHVAQLKAKVSNLKQSAVNFHNDRILGMTRPNLPAHSTMMDTDEFLIWFLHSDDLIHYKTLGGEYFSSRRDYRTDLVTLIEKQINLLKRECLLYWNR